MACGDGQFLAIYHKSKELYHIYVCECLYVSMNVYVFVYVRAHIYIYIYIRKIIYKLGKFCQKSQQKETLFRSAPFSRDQS